MVLILHFAKNSVYFPQCGQFAAPETGDHEERDRQYNEDACQQQQRPCRMSFELRTHGRHHFLQASCAPAFPPVTYRSGKETSKSSNYQD